MTVTPSRFGASRWTLDEARRRLHELARDFAGLETPSESLATRAIAVGRHRQGGLMLVPEIDVAAALEELEAQRRELSELEDDLETLGIMLLAEDRLADPTPESELLSLEDLAARHGVRLDEA